MLFLVLLIKDVFNLTQLVLIELTMTFFKQIECNAHIDKT